MKKSVFFILPAFAVILVFGLYPKEKLYKSTEGSVAFFSEAPLENIDATSKNIVSVINTSNNEIAFSVAINSFQFDNSKMRQDFNENFMESSRYADATYKGKINEKINWEEDGTYKVTSKGVLTIHGVAKQRTDTATVKIRSGVVSLKSNFSVRVSDHEIKIPKILFQKIAEVVAVKLDVDYSEYPQSERISSE